jgi:hypothetical protein
LLNCDDELRREEGENGEGGVRGREEEKSGEDGR